MQTVTSRRVMSEFIVSKDRVENMTTPLFSIVIPTYARPHILRECLTANSRLEERNAFEVIVVDDGSPEPVSAVVEAFTEETARTRRFPGIAFRGDDAHRRAWVIGTGLDVWEVVQMLEEAGAAEALTAETQVTPAQLRIALAYRDAYPEEIARLIEENRLPLSELRTLYPFVEVAEAD